VAIRPAISSDRTPFVVSSSVITTAFAAPIIAKMKPVEAIPKNSTRSRIALQW
jgi:hypothetical protein